MQFFLDGSTPQPQQSQQRRGPEIKCANCDKVLVGEVLEALGKKWHPACFVCPGWQDSKCNVNLKGTFYTGEDGRGYCAKHYYLSINLFCAVCETGITDGQV